MTRSLYALYCLLLLASSVASAKIVIFTYAFNRPDFIELQYKTFKKFFEDEYDFVVFSDAKTEEMHKKIVAMCDKYTIPCIRVPQSIHTKPYLERNTGSNYFFDYQSASVRNSNVVQYSLETLGFQHDDIVVLIDSDMFPVKKFNIRNFMQGYDVAGELIQCGIGYPRHHCKRLHPNIKRFEYLWIGLVFMDMRTMPNKNTINFNCGKVFRRVEVDAGGFTVHYLKANPSARVKGFLRKTLEDLICDECAEQQKPAPPCTHNTNQLKKFGLSDVTIQFAQCMPLVGNYLSKYGRPCEYLLDGTFFHYRAGTNYLHFANSYFEQKNVLFHDFFSELLK